MAFTRRQLRLGLGTSDSIPVEMDYTRQKSVTIRENDIRAFMDAERIDPSSGEHGLVAGIQAAADRIRSNQRFGENMDDYLVGIANSLVAQAENTDHLDPALARELGAVGVVVPINVESATICRRFEESDSK